jgi:hypothetical protein
MHFLYIMLLQIIYYIKVKKPVYIYIYIYTHTLYSAVIHSLLSSGDFTVV